MQLVTWNDYEEGTEIESGIDNCVSVSAAMAGNSLQWKIAGSEDTIDHYRVYVSSDGQNLMPLGGPDRGHVCPRSVRVFAGRGELQIVCAGHRKTEPEKPDFRSRTLCTTMRRNFTTVRRPAGRHSRHASGDFATAASVRFGNFAERLTIVGHDRGRTVGKSPDHGNRTIKVRRPHRALLFRSPGCDVVRLLSVRDYSGGKAATSVLRVSVVRPAHRPGPVPRPPRRGALVGFGLGMVGVLVLGQVDRKRILRGLALSSLIACVLLVSSCAGIPSGAEPAVEIAPGSYTIKVMATSAASQVSTVGENHHPLGRGRPGQPTGHSGLRLSIAICNASAICSICNLQICKRRHAISDC